MKLVSLMLILSLVASAHAACSSTGAFSNGDFETTISPWTAGSAIGRTNGEGSYSGTYAVAFNLVDVAGAGSVFQQCFTTVIGTTYVLRFYTSAYSLNGGTGQQVIEASVVGNSATLLAQNLTVNGLGVIGNTPWVLNTLVFTADATSTQIKFTDYTTLAGSYFVDFMLDAVTLTTQTKCYPANPYIVNGDFEASTSSIVGWVVNNQGGLVPTTTQGSYNGSVSIAFNGASNPGAGSFIQQCVSVVPGTSYTFSFFFGTFGTNGGPLLISVSVTGASSVLSVKNITLVATSGIGPFYPYNISFVADTDTALLRFTDYTTAAASPQSDPQLDYVRLRADNCSTGYAPYLAQSRSGMFDGSNLQLVYTAPAGLVNTSVLFVSSNNVNASCNYRNANNAFWTSSLSTVSCGWDYTGIIPINYALSQCGFTRDESNPTQTIFTTNMKVLTFALTATIRGVQIFASSETGYTVNIAFQTAINTTSSGFQVYGPRITFGSIISQTFNPTTYTATLLVLTSVQFPYQLDSAQITGVSGFTLSVAATNPDPLRTTSANCTTGSATSGDCAQYWTVTIRRTTSCNPGPTTISNSGWLVNFTVACRVNFAGACNTPNPGVDFITFDTTSDNYCPQLISTVQGLTATLTPFSDAARATQQNTFVFGTTTFFQVSIVSLISLQNVRLERVAITSGAAATVSTLYDATLSGSTSTYFSTFNSGTFSSQPSGFTGTFAASPTLMTVTDDIAGADSFRKNLRFQWVWSAATSGASGDASQPTTIQVNVRVRFLNQSTVSVPIVMNFKRHPDDISLLDTTSDATTAFATVGVTPSSTTVTPATNPTSTSSASGISTSTAAGVLAAVCAAAFVGVAALVVVLKKRQNVHAKNHTDAIMLTSTSSSTAHIQA